MLEEEEEVEGKPIRESDINEMVKKHGLYRTPELNEVLYLHYQGFTRIDNLSPFVNAKALWLNNNAISVMEGLDTLTNLTCLYLQNNLIEEITGLESLVNLDTLCLSHNFISRISGLESCSKLTTLDLDHNRLTTDGVQNLSQLKSLKIVNLTDNHIEDEDVIHAFEDIPELRVIRLSGNPVARSMNDYRRRIIFACKDLRFLDDAPVTEDDRRAIEAWGRGGIEEEKAERARIKQEQDERHRRSMEEFRNMVGSKGAEEEEQEEEVIDKAEGTEGEPASEFFVTEGVDVKADVD